MQWNADRMDVEIPFIYSSDWGMRQAGSGKSILRHDRQNLQKQLHVPCTEFTDLSDVNVALYRGAKGSYERGDSDNNGKCFSNINVVKEKA
jgi:hypothetical protein